MYSVFRFISSLILFVLEHSWNGAHNQGHAPAPCGCVLEKCGCQERNRSFPALQRRSWSTRSGMLIMLNSHLLVWLRVNGYCRSACWFAGEEHEGERQSRSLAEEERRVPAAAAQECWKQRWVQGWLIFAFFVRRGQKNQMIKNTPCCWISELRCWSPGHWTHSSKSCTQDATTNVPSSRSN